MTALDQQHCRPREGEAALTREAALPRLLQIPGWELVAPAAQIRRTFRFGNYTETMAFVNAVAAIAQEQDHHPDMQVSYNRCTVAFSTHAVGGLSENDFICAARVNALSHS